MKRIIKYLTVFLVSFTMMMGVKAESINSIDMDIYIDANGNAHVTETWRAYPTEKTEYYHAYHNIGNSDIINLKSFFILYVPHDHYQIYILHLIKHLYLLLYDL